VVFRVTIYFTFKIKRGAGKRCVRLSIIYGKEVSYRNREAAKRLTCAQSAQRGNDRVGRAKRGIVLYILLAGKPDVNLS